MRQMLTALRQLDARAGGFESARPVAPLDHVEERSPRNMAVDGANEPAAPSELDLAAPVEPDAASDEPVSVQEWEPVVTAQFDGLARLLQRAADRVERQETPAPEVDTVASSEPLAVDAPTSAERAKQSAPYETVLRALEHRQPLADQCSALADRLTADFSNPAALMFVSQDDNEELPAAIAYVGQLVHLRHHRDVVLVDANVGVGALSAGFALEGRPGLAEFYQACHANSVPEIYPTWLPGVSVLPCGSASLQSPNDWRLASSSLVATLHSPNRLTLIYGGNPKAAWTKSLASACDGVYLMLRLGQTVAADAAKTLDTLRRSGANVLGVIVTGAP